MFREKSTKCFNSNSTGTIVFQQDCLLFQSVLAPAVIAKFYRLGGLKNRNLFNLIFWRLGNPRRRYQHGLFLVRAPFWLVDNCLLTISTYVVGKEREHMSSLAFFLQFSSLQMFSRVWLFGTPWTAACQASLSITNSRSLLKLMSFESLISSSLLILCHPLLLPP